MLNKAKLVSSKYNKLKQHCLEILNTYYLFRQIIIYFCSIPFLYLLKKITVDEPKYR